MLLLKGFLCIVLILFSIYMADLSITTVQSESALSWKIIGSLGLIAFFLTSVYSYHLLLLVTEERVQEIKKESKNEKK